MPRLPPELEIQIFESVAKASPYDAALRLNLMLVAHRVQVWVEPFAYHCLVFSRVNNWARLKWIITSKPKDFLAKHVRSICMPLSTVTMEEASEILAACTGTERLACWIDHGAGPAPSIPIHALPLRRLSIELEHFLALPADLPALHAHLTHLELVYWGKHAESYPATVDLTRFSHLTHLALRSDAMYFQWSLEAVSSMMATCRRLKVVVLLDYFMSNTPQAIRQALNDSRVVVVLSEVAVHDWDPTAKPFHEWEIRVGRKEDMWARGEDIIRRNTRRID
ncbi:hypothetical protein B0H11DRAFT_2055917 [Mycena galericulata]|nr:hypothetical protein B0H11DRAFT_2055917 [Mycena galericulata]